MFCSTLTWYMCLNRFSCFYCQCQNTACPNGNIHDRRSLSVFGLYKVMNRIQEVDTKRANTTFRNGPCRKWDVINRKIVYIDSYVNTDQGNVKHICHTDFRVVYLFLLLCTYYFSYCMFFVVCACFTLSGLWPCISLFWFPLFWFPWLLLNILEPIFIYWGLLIWNYLRCF